MFKNLAPGAIGIQCSWLEGLDLAKAAGFAGADLTIGDMQALEAEQGEEALRAAYAERGLQPGGWGLPTNWRCSDVEFEDTVALLPEQARIAAAAGSSRCTTWVLGFSDTLTRKEHFDQVVRRFRRCAEILGEFGQRLGLEFIGPRTLRAGKRFGFVHTMDGMLALCCAIDRPNVGLLFDVWHWYTSRSTLDDVRQLAPSDVVYVHVNDAPLGVDVLDQIDNQRCLPAETRVIPNGELLRILGEIGYDGPVTAEPFNAALRELAARDPLAAAVRTRESLDALFAAAGRG